jgi:hypothetical protein
MEDPAVTRARNEQKAVVDLLKGDLSRIRKQIGAADYQKIDAHLEGVLAMERRIAPPTTTPTHGRLLGPASPTTVTSNSANYPTQVTQMMDLAAGLLACDVTRVMTLPAQPRIQRHRTHLARAHERPPHDVSRRHGSDHRADRDRQLVREAGRVPARKLDAVNEGTGTLLDNTLSCGGASLATRSTT